MNSTWSITDDVGAFGLALTAVLVLWSLLLLYFERRGTAQTSYRVLVTGALAVVFFALAVVRPVRVSSRTSSQGPRVLALIDDSRRLLISDGETTRRERANDTLVRLREHFSNSRLEVNFFGENLSAERSSPAGAASDLTNALRQVSDTNGERPEAIVVISDGRLTAPLASGIDTSLLVAPTGVPVHTVALTKKAPSDASLRMVNAAGAAVAHQALTMSIEVGCSAPLDCTEVPVTVRELLFDQAPAVLAARTVKASDGQGRINVDITLDRPGTRVVEVKIDAPEGDVIPENNVRYLTFAVAKERVRLLHLAGRPTYDVRALRQWLKSDESVDVVAFFILRGDSDDPGASEQELALIRFPVDELFTEHLPSFDAIILQDIDAIRYKLTRYLVRLEKYVTGGGGLIMVGGPSSFAGGNYAGTPLDRVLPLSQPRHGKTHDSEDLVPEYTRAGAVAPVTRQLRGLLGSKLPEMSGANLLGQPRPGAIVLWEHPKLTSEGKPMPLLALGEAGDGRSVALGVDSTFRLGVGPLAANVAGRAYGALWDGLLGWLMRDPRYEAARVELLGECIEGEPLSLRIHRLPGMSGDLRLEVVALKGSPSDPIIREVKDNHGSSVDVTLSPLAAGGYAARVFVGEAPSTRHDFGCEAGGIAWADSRPDPERLQRLASTLGGEFTWADSVQALPIPSLTDVITERQVSPLLPAWIWSVLAAIALGAHWIVRRQEGLP